MPRGHGHGSLEDMLQNRAEIAQQANAHAQQRKGKRKIGKIGNSEKNRATISIIEPRPPNFGKIINFEKIEPRSL